MTFLSRTECSALRGIAIMGIMLHNFLHWLGPMVKENEFNYAQDRVDRISYLVGQNDGDILWHIISFFGHYGVPVFLFLSGYGLVLKYERDNARLPLAEDARDALQFVWKHFKKFFPMMVLGFSVFAMVDWITPGRHHWTWLEIVAQLTMTINFLEEPNRIIWPGQYWFFGLMMQLYIVYRMMCYKRHWGVTVALIVVCWAVQVPFYDDPTGEMLKRIRYNFIGGMLPFGMGILLARYEKYRPLPDMNWSVLLLMLLVGILATVSFSLGYQTWLWVPAFVVLLHVAFVKLLPDVCLRPLDWVGALSASIFVCHAITRKIFIPISRGGDIEDGLAIYVLATFVLAMLFRKALK